MKCKIKELLKKKASVALIRFSGVIADQSNKRSGVSYQKFSKAIDKAFDVKNVKAVVLVINSPGGAPAQCSLISAHMRRLADEKNIPVYAFIEDVAASGGYWLSCIADEIYGQPSSIVGSIGVVSASFGFEDFIKTHGVKRRVTTAGKSKSFMDPFLPVNEADVKRLESLQTEIHKNFKAWVKERRGKRLNGTDSALFEGQFWAGDTALTKGLIDGIEDMHAVLRKKLGENIKYIHCTPSDKKLLSLLPFGSKLEMEKDSLIYQFLEAIETRSQWDRYGL